MPELIRITVFIGSNEVSLKPTRSAASGQVGDRSNLASVP
jgi:hypothetical protein